MMLADDLISIDERLKTWTSGEKIWLDGVTAGPAHEQHTSKLIFSGITILCLQ